MKIGIIGAGSIGGTLARKLADAGHEVKVANSRGPSTIEAAVLANGALATTAEDAASNVDVLILSIPLGRIPDVAPVVHGLPAETVIIDTSNYYPQRDGAIDAIEAGQVESLWVSDVLGWPVVKAWNAIIADSLAAKGKPPGSAGRIAIPVAGDDDQARTLGMALVEATGFDGVDAGPLATSWRQQPGAPAYCTDLTRDEMSGALAAVERERLPIRRDLALAAISERLGNGGANAGADADFLVRLSRVINM